MSCVLARKLLQPLLVPVNKTNACKSTLLLVAAALVSSFPVCGHDVITTKLTWSKEVSRVVYRRCLGCHAPGAKAFSLVTYADARPWAKAMQEEVLRRRMPPWNAVKGFGDFQHDAGLSQEEIHTISDWVDGGAPEGDANLLPPTPKPVPPVAQKISGPRLSFRGTLRLAEPFSLATIRIGQTSPGASFKLVAETPSGQRIPLLWIDGFSPKSNRDYVLKTPLRLRPGTRIAAYPPAGVVLTLIGS